MRPWNKTNSLSKRKANILKIRHKILIVCEGTKTEPKYFKKFPVKPKVVDVKVTGTGFNTMSLVDETISKMKEAEEQRQPYNQVWCVFDRDSFEPSDFDNAIKKAYANKIKVAFSNEAFELWYLLHFEYYISGISRDRYIRLLSKKIHELTQGHKSRYEKNDNDIYELLKEKQNIAIRNAKKLNSRYHDWCYSKHNPRTTVYLLVEELNRFI